MEGIPSGWAYLGLDLSSRTPRHISSLRGQEPPNPHCPQPMQLTSFQKMGPEPHISPSPGKGGWGTARACWGVFEWHRRSTAGTSEVTWDTIPSRAVVGQFGRLGQTLGTAAETWSCALCTSSVGHADNYNYACICKFMQILPNSWWIHLMIF